ncbi:hypothetical protein [Spiroplasma endosymbiont of Nebria brevicollis]|uniref:hypothetical protein n=1 Tax=Spiroplasma endosymbiont of Nebria brevicollis TaxID=3066284 RepID=UPI00313EE041
MAKKYLQLINIEDQPKRLHKVLKEINKTSNNKDKEKLRVLKDELWGDLQNIDLLLNTYLGIESINKFTLGNYFILPEEINSESSDIKLDGYEKTNQKFDKAISTLEKHQIEAKGFQEELIETFKISEQKVYEAKEKERIQKGDWKVNDLISAYIKDISGINSSEVTTFKVLSKKENNGNIILYNSSNKKKPIYKIRK